VVAPPKSLSPGKLRNFYRARVAKKHQTRRQEPVLGVIYTSSLTYTSTDIGLIESLTPLAKVMHDLPQGAAVLMRLRGEEDKAEVIENILSELGESLRRVDLKFETMADVPLRDFAHECDLVIELGIASSACHEMISRFVPCVRLVPQMPYRRRFVARKIPVLKNEEVQNYLKSRALRSKLIKAQFKALSADMRPGAIRARP